MSAGGPRPNPHDRLAASGWVNYALGIQAEPRSRQPSADSTEAGSEHREAMRRRLCPAWMPLFQDVAPHSLHPPHPILAPSLRPASVRPGAGEAAECGSKELQRTAPQKPSSSPAVHWSAHTACGCDGRGPWLTTQESSELRSSCHLAPGITLLLPHSYPRGLAGIPVAGPAGTFIHIHTTTTPSHPAYSAPWEESCSATPAHGQLLLPEDGPEEADSEPSESRILGYW